LHQPHSTYLNEQKTIPLGGKMATRTKRGNGKQFTQGLFVLCVVLALAIGCSSTTEISATSTPAPTDTPESTATNTRTPTLAATPTDTATPDLAATQAVLDTATMQAVQGVVTEKLTKLSIPVEGGRVAHFQSDPIIVASEGPNESSYEVLPMNEDLLNAVIHTNLTWTADSGISECGVVFNIVGSSWKDYYEFDMLKLSGLPYWFASKVSKGIYRGGQQHPENAIDVNDGATNNIVIVIKDKTVTYFVNDKKIQTSSDAGLTKKGGFGFSSWQESGSTQCTFSDIWVWTWDQ
jgi:hypothetical protein